MYRGQSGATSHLDAKIARGGSGVWGEVPMPPQPALGDDERGKIIAAVLKLADTVSETRGAKSGKIGLIARPAGAGAGGDWEFTVEAPGLGIGRKRVPASQGTAPEAR
jgi:hypothetical protein